MVVCSATLHAFEVKTMADRLMHFPTWVDLKVDYLLYIRIPAYPHFRISNTVRYPNTGSGAEHPNSEFPITEFPNTKYPNT